MNRKIKIAFIKFGGLSTGGTERWLQVMAVNLPKDKFDIDYYYCDSAPYVGSDYKHADMNPDRLKYMQDNNINLIKFKVGAKDVNTKTHKWLDSNFFNVFDENKYDIIQTAKAGPIEYPYYLIKKPVVEFVALTAGVDFSSNIVHSIHPSNWQRSRWFQYGGDVDKSSIIHVPVELDDNKNDLRSELNIPQEAIVAGFHQRDDDNIFSDIPLNSFVKLENDNRYFVIMGGSGKYRKQALDLSIKNIRFVEHSGNSRRIRQFLNTLDIFAHGRKDGETFGTVFAEAITLGKPCLSHYSDIANAQPETMGPAGFFANNLEEYISYLSLLYEDKNLRNMMGGKGKLFARENYTLERGVDKLISIYNKVLSNKNERDETGLEFGFSPMGFLYAGDMSSKKSIGFHIMHNSWPEEFEQKVVSCFLPEVKCFIDIGANTGIYNFQAAKHGNPGIKVYSYEPQADCCVAMRKTIWLNNWENKVFVEEIGLSDEPGEKYLELTGTGSSFEYAFNNDEELLKVKTRIDTLDNQVLKKNINKVDFIKIDVEGHEFKVLQGAEKVINRDKPVLFVEIAKTLNERQYINNDYKKTLKWIFDSGYDLYCCCGKRRKLIKIDNDYLPRDGVAMYLCLPRGFVVDGIDVCLAEYRKELMNKKKRKIFQLIKKGIKNPKKAFLWVLKKFLS